MTNKNVFVKIAEHHDMLAVEHHDMHKHVKDKHEAMDDSDEHKAYFGKLAAHHAACMKMHKDHAAFMRKAAEGAPVDTHGNSGDDLKYLSDEDLVKSFVGPAPRAARAVTALDPGRGKAEMPEPLADWTD
jgi:hypothetical protein